MCLDRRFVAAIGLACAALACRPTQPATPNAAVIATPLEVPVTLAAPVEPEAQPPPERSAELMAWLEAVSADRLMSDVEALSGFHTRHVNSPAIGAAAAAIYSGFEEAGGGWQVAYDSFPLVWNGIQSSQRNVVARLPGSDPAAGSVLVGAHYDSRTVDVNDSTSRAPGADDNATGVAALLEIARVLAGTTPRMSIVLVAFSAEEVGVVGSTHFVETAGERGDDVRAMFQLDIVGNASGQAGEGAIRVFSAPPPDSVSQHLARYAALQGRTYVDALHILLQPSVDRPGRYSDHVPFSDAGISSVRFIEVLEDTGRQHSGDDLPHVISPDYLRHSTQLALASLANLAFGPPAPALPAIQSGRLSWTPVEGVAGYLVAFRAADALDFGAVVRLHDATSLPLSAAGGGPYAKVSLAAIDAGGLVGGLSPELSLDP